MGRVPLFLSSHHSTLKAHGGFVHASVCSVCSFLFIYWWQCGFRRVARLCGGILLRWRGKRSLLYPRVPGRLRKRSEAPVYHVFLWRYWFWLRYCSHKKGRYVKKNWRMGEVACSWLLFLFYFSCIFALACFAWRSASRRWRVSFLV